MLLGSGYAYTQKPVERPPGWVPPPPPDAPELAYAQQAPQQDDLAEDLDKKLSVAPPIQPQPQPQAPEQSSQPYTDVDPLGEWTLKEITWPDPRIGGFRRTVKVLTQNANGPCSLLALANVLILRGSIHISQKQDKISYAQLSSLIADFLVTRPQLANARGLTLEAALNILPTTVRGLNINVGFNDIKSFQATTEGSSDELALFEMAGVELVHGWIVDTNGEEWEAMRRVAGEGVPTYDSVQEAIVKGMGTDGQAAKDGESIARMRSLTGADCYSATVLQSFLQSTGTQLTFPGLFALNALEPGSVVAVSPIQPNAVPSLNAPLIRSSSAILTSASSTVVICPRNLR